MDTRRQAEQSHQASHRLVVTCTGFVPLRETSLSLGIVHVRATVNRKNPRTFPPPLAGQGEKSYSVLEAAQRVMPLSVAERPIPRRSSAEDCSVPRPPTLRPTGAPPLA